MKLLSPLWSEVFQITEVSKCDYNSLFFLPSSWGTPALKASGPIALIISDSRHPELESSDRPALRPVLFQDAP